MMHRYGLTQHTILYICAAVIVTIFTIYLTPLKWLNIVEPTVWDIDAKEFQSEFTAHPDNYIFIDVRPEAAYRALHAKGSSNMPLATLYDTRHVLPKSGKTIILICSGGRASGIAFSYLQHYGFFNIRRVGGGIETWVLDNLPVEGTQASTRKILPGE